MATNSGNIATEMQLAFAANAAITPDDDTSKVFRFVLQKSAAPGWMIVKELGQDADKTEDSLKKLRDLGLIEGDGVGLDGFYHATSLGYRLRSLLSA